MVTDTYNRRLPDISARSMLKNNDFSEDLSSLIRRQEAMSEREKELSMYRSGSAPPTVEGSLSAVGGLFDAGLWGFDDNGGKGLVTKEELRSDPAYVDYYYSNVNLNPWLPTPLLSREDWRFAQRLHCGAGGRLGGIGDRRKGGGGGAGDGSGKGNGSLFSVQPGIAGKEDNEVEAGKGTSEWGGDGLIGLSGLGLGSTQNSLAEIVQANFGNGSNPPQPASCNAFDGKVEYSETQLAHRHPDMARSSGNKQGVSAVHSVGTSTSQTYASALGVSLSRSSTPDPQLVARAPSPRIPTVGGRLNATDRRSVYSPNSSNGVSQELSKSVDLVAALSGMKLSTNGMLLDDGQSIADARLEIDDHQCFSDFPGDRSYVNGTSNPAHNARHAASLYQNVATVNSAFPKYGTSDFAFKTLPQSMMGGQLESGSLSPLLDRSSVSAMGIGGIDARSLGSLALGPTAELQNFSSMGDHTSDSIPHKSSMNQFYHQYMRSNELAAAQAAFDSEGLGTAFADSLEFRKTYLGMLISQQKAQLSMPYIGKSGILTNGYYGNPTFSPGMSYDWNQSAAALLQSFSGTSGSLNGQNDWNLHISSGMRHSPVGVMGAWHSGAGGNPDRTFASSLLDEFKSSKTKCFELSQIAGHVVDFSADQYGSRFIQQKLETASNEEKDMVFQEIMPHALSLMTDVFGNYVIQKFLEHGTASQIRELADQLTDHVLALSLQMYGCRVIQKAIEVVDLDQQTKMVTELDGHVMRCVRDQNGNHVIQKCIECVPEDAIQFIISTFYDQVVILSTHPYGCRVIQRVLEHCHDAKTQSKMMEEILQSVCLLAQDQYGNYVVQHVLEHGKPHERSAIIKQLTGQIVPMSQQKFASNVIEKCLTFGTLAERQILINEMLGTTDENEPLQVMMKDQFANYVVQKVLETCDDQQLELILNRIKVHLNALKKYTYGKHIVARVEKLVAAGERRISILTPQPAQVS